jgi:hypothetical protein
MCRKVKVGREFSMDGRCDRMARTTIVNLPSRSGPDFSAMPAAACCAKRADFTCYRNDDDRLCPVLVLTPCRERPQR